MRLKLSLLALIGVLVIALNLLNISQPTNAQEDVMPSNSQPLAGKHIYFAEGAGESTRFDRTPLGLSRFAGILTNLGAELFTLEWRSGIPADADLVVIAGPTRDYPAYQIARLWHYINQGGRVLLLADLSAGRFVFSEKSDFSTLTLSDMGFQLRDFIIGQQYTQEAEIVDENGTTSTITQTLLNTSFLATNINRQHPITANLPESLALSWDVARPLTIDASIQSFVVSPLVFTDTTLYGESDYANYLNNQVLEFNIGRDLTQGPLVLGVAFEEPRQNGRFVILGDREFVINGFGFATSPDYSASFIYPGNVQFATNSVLWLLELDPVSMEFATPAPTATPTIVPTPTVPPTPTATPSS